MHPDGVLVILIPGFAKDERDSNCLPAQQRFILGLNQFYPNLRVYILAFQYPYGERDYEWHGNRVFAFGGRNRGGVARRLLWYRVSKKLNAIEKKENVSGVLAFWAGECAWVGKRWADRNQKKFFCWIMGQDALPTNNYIRAAGLQPNEMVAISDIAALRVHQYHGLIPSYTIPIGIDPAWVPGIQRKKKYSLLCAGSLIPLKQYDLAITVMKEIVSRFPEANLVIAGDGPEKEMLRKKIDEQKLGDHIQLAGELPHSETLELMSRSMIFLHPSSTEGFSMSCVEAIACGATVISFEQPMKKNIPHWHVVKNLEEMTALAITMLSNNKHTEPVFPYSLRETVDAIAALFFDTSASKIVNNREAIAVGERES